MPARVRPASGSTFAGAVTATLASLLAVYAVVDGNRAGWMSLQTIVLLVLAALSLAAFLLIEKQSVSPLMPLSLFRIRHVVAANLIGVLWAAAMFAWVFIAALYLQRGLGYDPRQVGMAFLLSNVIMAIVSVGVSARLVARYGFRGPLAIGLWRWVRSGSRCLRARRSTGVSGSTCCREC